MATLMMADAILIEATLSFLGMDPQPFMPSWSSVLASRRAYRMRAPWVTFLPGIAIMLTVLGFNHLGDGLRDAPDPFLKDRQQPSRCEPWPSSCQKPPNPV